MTCINLSTQRDFFFSRVVQTATVSASGKTLFVLTFAQTPLQGEIGTIPLGISDNYSITLPRAAIIVASNIWHVFSLTDNL